MELAKHLLCWTFEENVSMDSNVNVNKLNKGRLQQ